MADNTKNTKNTKKNKSIDIELIKALNQNMGMGEKPKKSRKK